ncbi:MAG: glycoside hydrolase family 66 protein [Solirubrobacteraceae bacterium]
MTRLLSDLRTLYLTDEEIIIGGLGSEVSAATIRTAFGETVAGVIAADEARFGDVPAGTHTVEIHTRGGLLMAEEFVSVRADRGEDPILGFATSFDDATVPESLDWLRGLRCTVVQVYDWMERYSKPLGPPGVYHDPLGREVSRSALEALVAGIRRMGAVAQAYAPVCAGDRGAHPQWRLLRNDGSPEALGDLLEVMDPGNREWQQHWLEHYGRAADVLGFDGFHLDTYGYPRDAINAHGVVVDVREGYAAFIAVVRQQRPSAVISFNQVNGVPAGITPAARPAFRYVEVWPPNDRWRHLEGLMARSAGRMSEPYGDTLAIYPPVWSGDRPGALRTVVLTEAIGTALGLGTLIFGDAAGALSHPYYVRHERLAAEEAATVLEWHRFGLRCRDLFRRGNDTSWFELDDENAAVTVAAAVPVRPEPLGGSLFARVVQNSRTLAVSLLDLSGSKDGSWSSTTAGGTCAGAQVTALVQRPECWRAQVAVLGRNGGRFVPVPLTRVAHREGRAVRCQVPIAAGWSVLRLENGNC